MYFHLVLFQVGSKESIRIVNSMGHRRDQRVVLEERVNESGMTLIC